MPDKKIRVLVPSSGENESGPQAMTDVAALVRNKLAGKVVEVNIDTLEASLIELVSKILPLMDRLPESKTHAIQSLDVNLAIDSQGEISVVGMLSGNLQIGSGITVTLVKKNRRISKK